MKVGPSINPAAHAWALQLSQMTGRVAAHQSTPTAGKKTACINAIVVIAQLRCHP